MKIRSSLESILKRLKNYSPDLLISIDRIYDIYLYFLLSFDELREISEQKIVEGKNKIISRNWVTVRKNCIFVDVVDHRHAII